MTGLDRH